jgi:hypothetical protein
MRRPSRQGLLLACTLCISALAIALSYASLREQESTASARTLRNTTSFTLAVRFTPEAPVLPCPKLLAHKILAV